MADLRLLLVDLQEQLLLDVRSDVRQRPLRRLPASAQDHHVVRIANEPVSPSLKLVIELVEQDVGENRADWSALWRSDRTGFALPVLRYRSLQELVDQRDDPSVPDAFRQDLEKL